MKRREADPEQLVNACEEASTHLRFTYCRDVWGEDTPPDWQTFKEVAPADVIIRALLRDKVTYEKSIGRLQARLTKAERAVCDLRRSAQAVVTEFELIGREEIETPSCGSPDLEEVV